MEITQLKILQAFFLMNKSLSFFKGLIILCEELSRNIRYKYVEGITKRRQRYVENVKLDDGKFHAISLSQISSKQASEPTITSWKSIVTHGGI